MVRVGEARLQLHRAGLRIDLVVGGGERAVGELRRLLAVPGFHRDDVTRLQALHHRGKQVLRNGIEHGDRLELRDDDDAVGVAGVHDVAGIDLPQAEAAADRRGDARIGELQPRVLHLTRVHADRAFVLAHERSLGVDLLLGDRILLEERVVALEVEPRVLEERPVARELSLGLLELHLEGARIDLGKELALLHKMAFLEEHAHELAIDAGLHRHCAQRCHGAEPIDDDVDVALCRRHGNDRRAQRRAAPRTAGPALGSARGGGRRGLHAPSPVVIAAHGQGRDDDDADQHSPFSHQSSSV